jgi:hypothetical protein
VLASDRRSRTAPFTLAHPAAVLPLARLSRRPGVLSALIIGSIAPDLAYVLPLAMAHRTTHTLVAIAWFCLPVGLFVHWVFHRVVKEEAVSLLPPALGRRVPPTHRRLGWQPADVLVRAAAIGLGALTHVAWDAFTHRDGPIVTTLPLLQTLLFERGNYPAHAHSILQHGSTVLGLTCVAWSLGRWMARTPAASASTRPVMSRRLRAHAVAGILGAAIAVATWKSRRVIGLPLSVPTIQTAAWFAITGGAQGLLGAVLACSLLRRLRSQLAGEPPAPGYGQAVSGPVAEDRWRRGDHRPRSWRRGPP